MTGQIADHLYLMMNRKMQMCNRGKWCRKLVMCQKHEMAMTGWIRLGMFGGIRAGKGGPFLTWQLRMIVKLFRFAVVVAVCDLNQAVAFEMSQCHRDKCPQPEQAE